MIREYEIADCKHSSTENNDASNFATIGRDIHLFFYLELHAECYGPVTIIIVCLVLMRQIT